MEQSEIIAFFDHCAPSWDANMIRDDRIIDTILDLGGVHPGADILDVACGTGVLIPDYLKRQAASVTGVDISPEMVRIAASKFRESNVQILCGDVETITLPQKYDCIMIYNAFPHFPEPKRLIHRLSTMLKPGGHLTVAHGMSRDAIDRHHHGAASHVSMGLMHEQDLAGIFASCLHVTTVISNDRMYQVTGKKEADPA